MGRRIADAWRRRRGLRLVPMLPLIWLPLVHLVLCTRISRNDVVEGSSGARVKRGTPFAVGGAKAETPRRSKRRKRAGASSGGSEANASRAQRPRNAIEDKPCAEATNSTSAFRSIEAFVKSALALPGCQRAHAWAMLEIDRLGRTLRNPFLRKAARVAVHVIGEHVGAFLGEGHTVDADGIRELALVICAARDPSTTRAVFSALGRAASDPHEATILRAISGIEHALLADVRKEPVGLADFIKCALSSTTSPTVARAVIDMFLRSATRHIWLHSCRLIAEEIGVVVNNARKDSAVAVLDMLLVAIVGDDDEIRKVAVELLRGLVVTAPATRLRHVVRTILDAAWTWSTNDIFVFTQELELWLLEDTRDQQRRLVLEAVAPGEHWWSPLGLAPTWPTTHPLNLEYPCLLMNFSIDIFEESTKFEQAALDAMTRLAVGSSDARVRVAALNSLHQALLFGDIDAEKMQVVKTVVEIATRTAASDFQSMAIEALARSMTHPKGSHKQRPDMTDTVALGMAKIARSSADPFVKATMTLCCLEVWATSDVQADRRRMLELLSIGGGTAPGVALIDRVAEDVLRRAPLNTLARAVSCLLRRFLLDEAREETSYALMAAAAVLAEQDRVTVGIAALHRVLRMFASSTHAIAALRSFAVHVFGHYDVHAARLAATTLVKLSRDSPYKAELVAWIGISLPGTRPMAGYDLVRALVRIALGSHPGEAVVNTVVVRELGRALRDPAMSVVTVASSGLVRFATQYECSRRVELAVVEALGSVAGSPPWRRSRLLVRSLAKMAAAHRSAEVGLAVGKLLSKAALGSDLASARWALRGLLQGSAKGDTEFRELAWATVAMAMQRSSELQPEVRKTIQALSQLKEEALQITNERVAAESQAPAA
mmetsp:Transcript_36138/g.103967  ORF Transcript_36138/g.103967 Transcript_36138/m.103967 type:complete len:889 (-) Transcript_36138:159-2825(-)